MVNDVKLLKKDDYLNAINLYLERLKKDKNVEAVFKVGNIDYPGTSDVDLVIVLNGKIKNIDINNYSITKCSDKDRYIFMHEPSIINIQLVENLKILYPFSNIDILFTKKHHEIYKINEPKKEHYLHFLITEYIHGFMFWPYRSENLISLRRIILLLNTLKYTVAIFNKIFSDNKEINDKMDEYIELITILRKNIFDMKLFKIKIIINEMLKILKFKYNYISNYLHNYLLNKFNITMSNFPLYYFGFLPGDIVTFYKNNNWEFNFWKMTIRSLPSSFIVVVTPYTNGEDNIINCFEQRKNIIRQYEEFIYFNKLEKLMMLTRMHSKYYWMIKKYIKNRYVNQR